MESLFLLLVESGVHGAFFSIASSEKERVIIVIVLLSCFHEECFFVVNAL